MTICYFLDEFCHIILPRGTNSAFIRYIAQWICLVYFINQYYFSANSKHPISQMSQECRCIRSQTCGQPIKWWTSKAEIKKLFNYKMINRYQISASKMASSKLISSVTHLGVHIFFTKHWLMLDTQILLIFLWILSA